LSEALALRPADLRLEESFAFLPETKNGAPRPVHLPPIVHAALARLDLTGKTVFRMTKCGRLYSCLNRATAAAAVTVPDGIAFHIFRHSYGAWMRRYAGLDTTGLVSTGAWKSRQAAAIYEHADVSEEGRKADLLPTRGNIGGRLR
jgi:integrase